MATVIVNAALRWKLFKLEKVVYEGWSYVSWILPYLFAD